MNTTYTLAVCNAVLCFLIMFTCGCRQAASSKRVLIRVRWGYSVLGTVALLKAAGPYFGEWPGWIDLALEAGMLAVLFAGSMRWRYGAPLDVQSDYQPLVEQKEKPACCP